MITVESAHRQQRGDERRLAPDAVAEVAEQRRADRAGRRTRSRTSRARRAWPRPGSEAGKNSRGKHDHRGRRVDVEVEELDRRADQAREEHLTSGIERRAALRGLTGRLASSPGILTVTHRECKRPLPLPARCGKQEPAKLELKLEAGSWKLVAVLEAHLHGKLQLPRQAVLRGDGAERGAGGRRYWARPC